MSALSKLMQKWFLIGLVLANGVAQAANEPLEIHSIRTVYSSPQLAEVEIIGSYDGSYGELMLAATARTAEGLTRSYSFIPVIFPKGSQVKVKAKILPPAGFRSHDTELLMVNFFTGSLVDKYVVSKKLKWQHKWVGLDQEPYSDHPIKYMEVEKESTIEAFRALLREEDFASIDNLFEDWRLAKNIRDADGGWTSEGFMEAIHWMIKKKNWTESLEKIERWKIQNPKSIGAAITEIIYWTSYANLDLSQFSDSLRKAAAKVKSSRLSKAELVLLNTKSFASSSPLWYQAYLEYLIAEGSENNSFEVTASEGIQKYPTFLPLYLSRLKGISNIQSVSDFEKTQLIVNEALLNTSKADGMSNLAEIISVYRHHFKMNGKTVLQIFSWPIIRAAMEDLNKRYPSVANMNKFAEFACVADDKLVYLSIRQKLKIQVISDLWNSGYALDLCDAKFTIRS